MTRTPTWRPRTSASCEPLTPSRLQWVTMTRSPPTRARISSSAVQPAIRSAPTWQTKTSGITSWVITVRSPSRWMVQSSPSPPAIRTWVLPIRSIPRTVLTSSLAERPATPSPPVRMPVATPVVTLSWVTTVTLPSTAWDASTRLNQPILTSVAKITSPPVVDQTSSWQVPTRIRS